MNIGDLLIVYYDTNKSRRAITDGGLKHKLKLMVITSISSMLISIIIDIIT